MSPLTAVSRPVPDGPEGAPLSPRGPAGSWSSPQESPPGTESCFSPREPPPAAGRSGGGSAVPGRGQQRTAAGRGGRSVPAPPGSAFGRAGSSGVRGDGAPSSGAAFVPLPVVWNKTWRFCAQLTDFESVSWWRSEKYEKPEE